MRPMSLLVAVLVSVVLSCGVVDAGQQTPGPAIRSVVADVSGDLLTITGTGFGAQPVVAIDGEPVAVLPGGSDTQVVVQAPAVLKAVPGAYRLTIVDPVQNAGDAFVIVGPQIGTPVVAANTGAAVGGTPKLATAPVEATTAAVSAGTDPASAVDGDKATIDNSNNTALGFLALSSVTTGYNNAAFGPYALRFDTTGFSNTALGAVSLYNNTGNENTASGSAAMYFNTTGGSNAAFGHGAMYLNSVGSGNTSLGYQSLFNNATGNFNVGVGLHSGINNTTGSYNIWLGPLVYGDTGDANTIRIGTPYNGTSGQNRTFIAGIRGTTVSGGAPVVINANGQMGTAPATGFTLAENGTVTLASRVTTTSGNIGTFSNHDLSFLTNNTARMTIGATGNVGIGVNGLGTTTPYAKLQVNTGLNDGLLISNGTLNGVLFASGLLGQSFAFGTQTNHPFVFGTNNSFDRMTIAANGNVGIGTYFPVAKLDVIAPINNGVRFSDGTTVGIFFPSGILGNSFAIGTQSNHALVFGVGDQWGRLTIAPGGNVGVGTLAPQHPLHMASGAYASSGGAWVNASSRALKDQIAALPAAAALAAFDHLEPVTFVYKADPGETHVGFIAEDVPELVATADRKSLSAMDIVALVTRVVQSQRDQLAAQQAIIAELMQRLARIEAAGQRADTPVVTAASR